MSSGCNAPAIPALESDPGPAPVLLAIQSIVPKVIHSTINTMSCHKLTRPICRRTPQSPAAIPSHNPTPQSQATILRRNLPPQLQSTTTWDASCTAMQCDDVPCTAARYGYECGANRPTTTAKNRGAWKMSARLYCRSAAGCKQQCANPFVYTQAICIAHLCLRSWWVM